jgi:hypothetical protein
VPRRKKGAVGSPAALTGAARVLTSSHPYATPPPHPKDGTIVPESFATKQQLEQLGAKLGVDVNAAVDIGSKAARKRKKQKTG